MSDKWEAAELDRNMHNQLLKLTPADALFCCSDFGGKKPGSKTEWAELLSPQEVWLEF